MRLISTKRESWRECPDRFRLGVIDDLPAEEYHSTHAMSAGGLKRMRISPAHFYGLQLDPNRPASGEPSPAMRNGTLTHCALFEPDEVCALRRQTCRGRFQDQEGKAWKAALTRWIVRGRRPGAPAGTGPRCALSARSGRAAGEGRPGVGVLARRADG